MTAPCRHCGKLRNLRPKSLCCSCYRDRLVRDLYPSTSQHWHGNYTAGETQEQLDALVEERRATAPAWFFKEVLRGLVRPAPYTIPLIQMAARGRRVSRKNRDH